MAKIKEDTRPLGNPRSWAQTNGTLISGRAHIDGADYVAVKMEDKWGAGRLRLLVSPELREKFDRQRFKLNAAIWHGDLEAVRQEAERMVKAWMALDRAAEDAGAERRPAGAWEVTLEDGTVAVIALDHAAAQGVIREGRRMAVYTLDEIGTMLSHYREVVTVKDAFPGSTVERISRTISDPLDGIRDGVRLEDTLDDPIPNLAS